MLLKIICVILLVANVDVGGYRGYEEVSYDGEDVYGNYEEDNEISSSIKVKGYEKPTVKTLSPQEIQEVRGAIKEILSGRKLENPFTPLPLTNQDSSEKRSFKRAIVRSNRVGPLYNDVLRDKANAKMNTMDDNSGSRTANYFHSTRDYLTKTFDTPTEGYQPDADDDIIGATINMYPKRTSWSDFYHPRVLRDDSSQNIDQETTLHSEPVATPINADEVGTTEEEVLEEPPDVGGEEPPVEDPGGAEVEEGGAADDTGAEQPTPATNEEPPGDNELPPEGGAVQDTEGEKAPSGDNKETPEGATEDSAGGVVEQPSADAEKNPSGDAEKDPSAEAEKDPSGDAEKDPSAEAKEDPAGDAEKDPSGDAEKDPSEDAEKDPSGDTAVTALASVAASEDAEELINEGPTIATHTTAVQGTQAPSTTTFRATTLPTTLATTVTRTSQPTTTTKTMEPTTTTKRTTRQTTTKFQLDVPALLEIIANLTYDYEMNLTDNLNETLIKLSIPTCATPTTTPPPRIGIDYDANATGIVIAKCFVCGLEVEKIPHNAHCADAFAGDFLPLVPVDMTARGYISKYRKYCRYLDVNHYVVNASQPRSVYGRWSGGCAVRWIDLSGVYTQRTCRNRERATLGKHFASKRMAKLEMALSNVDNGCIASPMATLVPLSRGISLYARFHACVCTGSWCNMASLHIPWMGSILAPFLVGLASPYWIL